VSDARTSSRFAVAKFGRGLGDELLVVVDGGIARIKTSLESSNADRREPTRIDALIGRGA